ncbi:DMT family transporter [Aestuariicella hydrocarbonica]|uniref:DMT family transporter n=1 Tax=Pseudomaricurvus hydrocarbonicus TaxID=1470433 RepID=A0A9E5MJM2_9GAMM|nr:DMT family transporter [Aestuariicella hydrocarbonica]
MTQHPHPLKGVFFGIVTVLIWAAFPIFTKFGYEDTLTPSDVSILRYVTAGLIMLPFLLSRGFKGIPPLGLLIIVCGAGLPYLMSVSLGLQYSSAGHFALITPSTMLLCSTLGGCLLFKEAMSPMRLLGIVMVLCGLILVGIDSLHTEVASWQGDALFVLGGCLWACYTLSLRQWQIEPLHATAVVGTTSMLLCVPLYLLGNGSPLLGESQLLTASWQTLATQAIYQGVFSSILALVFYSQAVSLLGPGKGAIFGAIVPGVSLLLAIGILGEPATFLQYSGVVVIFAGVTVTLEMFKLARKSR